MALNVVAFLYSTFLYVFLLFPPYQPVSQSNMKYVSVVIGAFLMFSAFC